MIAEDFRIEGFDVRAFAHLVSLFGVGRRQADVEANPRGTLVVVRSEDGTPCASFVTGRGPVDVEAWQDTEGLESVCRRLGVRSAIIIDEGAIEELTERIAARIGFGDDYLKQWLAMLSVARELELESKILFWPRRAHVPLPTPAMLKRALDLVLPDETSIVLALWDGEELWTGCALARRGGELSWLAGPELLLGWAGPLGGDFRRDHRQLTRAVSNAMAPVHLGIFAQRDVFEALLRSPEPGAWARAVALRDVILSPAAPYAHVAVGADALRAAGRRARTVFGGIDLGSYFAPIASFAREHVAHVGSLTGILGFNPLQALAARLQQQRQDPSDLD